MWAVLGADQGLNWRSLEGIRAYLTGAHQGLCWRSWAALKAYVGGLGSRSGPMWAVLGADQGLSWRSWPVLGPKWSVLEGDQGEKWPKPEREGLSGEGMDFCFCLFCFLGPEPISLWI